MKPTTIITTVRHGKKHTDGSLMPEGKIQSAHRALDISHLEGDVILFHSGEARVRETIQVIGGNIHKQTPEELENILEEKHDLQDYIVPSLHFLKNRTQKSSYFAAWQGETNEAEIENFLEGEQPDEAGFNALTMAKNIAHVLHTELQFSLLTSPECRSNFINGTHEPVIMAFLYYALQQFSPKETPQQFLKTIGESVHYTEGFDVLVYQHSDRPATIELKFRNFTVPLSLKELNEFSQ